jgi:hypothetical protein
MLERLAQYRNPSLILQLPPLKSITNLIHQQIMLRIGSDWNDSYLRFDMVLILVHKLFEKGFS